MTTSLETPHLNNAMVVIASDEEAYRCLEEIKRRARRREVYGRTEPRGEDLCVFDAYGMDVVEGRG